MLEKLIEVMHSIVLAGGSAGVFLAVLFEEVVFFVPSSIVPVAAGFFLISPEAGLAEVVKQAFLYIAIPVSLGLTLGSLIPYYICYFGGRPAVEKWGRLLGFNWSNIEKTGKKFNKAYHDELILFGLRILPLFPSVAVSGFCGFIRYPIYNFLIATAFGSVIRGFFLSLLGWYTGAAYLKYAQLIEEMEKYLFFTAGIVILVSILWFLRKKRKQK